MEKTIKKAELPRENPFLVNDKFIENSFQLRKGDYVEKSVKFHFTDNYIFIEYEATKPPVILAATSR